VEAARNGAPQIVNAASSSKINDLCRDRMKVETVQEWADS
jgi:hypothetical protein